MYGAEIAKQNDIPHFVVVTGGGVSKTSWFWASRAKADLEESLTNAKLPYLSIFRPGFLLNRRNGERLSEKISKFIPCIPKIQISDVGKAMRIDAEELHLKKPERKPVVIYENKEMLNMVRNK